MKRLVDIVGALVGLTLSSPLMMGIALLIKASSPGPALFSQARVGRHGRDFRVYKFRSMVSNAELLGTSVTTAADRRVTPVGRVLRRTKLDELPQLWNVLMGEMSLIGPRPDVPEIVATYSHEMRRVLDIRPGITSIATLYLRDEESLLALSRTPDLVYDQILVPFKVALALEHVERDSVAFDAKVLLLTLWALTIGRLFPPLNAQLVEIVRRDILNYDAVPAAEKSAQTDQNWKQYRRLVHQSCGKGGLTGRGLDHSALAHNSSMERI